MNNEYVITATIPVPTDFDGQAEVANQLREPVTALREAALGIGGQLTTAVVKRSGARKTAKKPAKEGKVA